jgi:hypothetical protein
MIVCYENLNKNLATQGLLFEDPIMTEELRMDGFSGTPINTAAFQSIESCCLFKRQFDPVLLTTARQFSDADRSPKDLNLCFYCG